MNFREYVENAKGNLFEGLEAKDIDILIETLEEDLEVASDDVKLKIEARIQEAKNYQDEL